jgi:hypothetical protein
VKIPVEEIINRCETVYKLSLKTDDKYAQLAYRGCILGFLDICLIFEDIPHITFNEINCHYKDKFDGIEQDTYLLGYDLSKIKVKIINDNNINNEM